MKRPYRWLWMIALALLCAGCGAQPRYAGEVAPSTITPIGGEAPPALPPGTPVTEGPPSPTPVSLPEGLTGYELIAEQIGEAVYRGRSCAISPIGCACETELDQIASFAFQGDLMTFAFRNDLYDNAWEMTRSGLNQWSYETPMFDEEGDYLGMFIALMTFTEEGYLYDAGAHFADGNLVTCPTVTWRRILYPEELTATP